MELAFPLGAMVASLGGGALALWAVHVAWSWRGEPVAALASALWQWCLAFLAAVAAFMLAHVASFGLTVPGVTRVIGSLDVIWGSERWSDGLAFALDPVAAALLAGPMLLVAVTAFIDTSRASPSAITRVRGVAMLLGLAGLACVAMARSHGGSLAGWITVAFSSLLAAHTRRPSHPAGTESAASGSGRAALVRREVVALVLVALAAACGAWASPSWAFDPLVLSVVEGDGSPLRQVGPLGAPVAETMTVALVVAAALRLGVWPLSAPRLGEPRGRGDGDLAARMAAGTEASLRLPPDAALDALAVIRDASAIALLIRYDAVLALAPVPLAALGMIASMAALVSAASAWASRACAAASEPRAVTPRPAAAAVALVAIASFLPELAVAVVALAGATWWVLRRSEPDGTRVDALLRGLLAPLPLGLGLAVVSLTVATWTHVSALSPLYNALALLACLAVGLGLARAAVIERSARPIGLAWTSPDVATADARRAAQIVVALAVVAASVLLLPPWSGQGSALSRAFATHLAIPRGLTGAFATGPARGWGDGSPATTACLIGTAVALLVVTVLLGQRMPRSAASGSEALAVDRRGRRGETTWLAWIEASPGRLASGAAQLAAGLGAALEFGVGRVALRDFVALGSDELDRAIASKTRGTDVRRGLGLALLTALVLGTIFANAQASSLWPTSMYGLPGLRARQSTPEPASRVEPSPSRGGGASQEGR